MKDATTLSRLVNFTRRHRYTATQRECVCPVCDGAITLADGVYGCEVGHSFGELRELAVCK